MKSLLAFALLLPLPALATEIALIKPETVHARLQSKDAKPLIVDVREPHEFEAGHIDGALLAPLAAVKEKLAGVPKDREIVLVCRSGRRSGKAWETLTAAGFTKLWNMQGGMLAWEKLGYPVKK
jgi:rhodanese-related sulfurtransferase